jgi:hypothetical protein
MEMVAGVFAHTVVDPLITLVGLGFTVSVTMFETSSGVQLPLTISLYLYPFILTVAPVMLSDAVVAPAYTPPLFTSVKLAPLSVLICHLYVKLDPVATAVKVVFCPSQIVLSVGSVVITGAVKIVNVWLLEFEPQLFVVVSVSV